MEINFPQKIISDSFEAILKKYYHKSKYKKYHSVIFDFSSAMWFGIFELSIISLWLFELRESKKERIVILPNELRIQNFLTQYGFIEFLEKDNIKINNKISTKSINPRYLFNAPFYPLSFFDEDVFQSILEDLSLHDRLDIIFEEVKDVELIKSGAIRDVVLNELGNNIFIHSKKTTGNLIMTKYPELAEIDKEKKLTYSIKESSYYEKDFFRKLGGRAYLELIICDKGIGIYKTLVEAYHEDRVIKNKKQNPTELDIIEYSFLYHSSRRTITERIGSIKNVISEQTIKLFPPPTGLYRLKEIVKEFHGLLYVRSGSSILCYDFLNNRFDDKPKTNGKAKLAPFGGTQYKLLFPVETPREKVFIFSLSDQNDSRNRDERIIQGDYITLKHSKYITTINDQATFLYDVIEEIGRKKVRTSGGLSYLIIDGMKDMKLPSKVLHYLIYEAMNIQDGNFAVIFTNVDFRILDLKRVITKNKRIIRRAILMFDETTSPSFFGLTEDESDLASKIVTGNIKYSNEKISKFVSANTHLFLHNESENSYSFLYTPRIVTKLIINHIKDKISSIILDKNSFIFYKNIKVLIPSKYYCEGYFEIHRLLAKDEWKKMIISYYRYIIIEMNPDFVISVTGHCGEIIDETLRYVKNIGYEKRISHINFKTPISSFDLAQIVLDIGNGEKGIIVTDVIGTAETIKSILDHAHHINIYKIFCFVDARENLENWLDYRRKTFSIEYFIKQKFYYHRDKPPGWLYSEIYEVDTKKNQLIYNPSKISGPIWKNVETKEEKQNEIIVEKKYNQFLEDIVYPSIAFKKGHYGSKEKHLLYLFNIPKITKFYLEEITSVIVKNAETYLLKVQPPKKISHIFYPSFNPGLHELAYKVSSKFKESIPLAIDIDEFTAPIDQDDPSHFVEGAIIIDDAFVSGDSIYRMLDIVERKGANIICVYIIIKRGNDYNARKLEKIAQYGRAEILIKYLADVQLPVYSGLNCPICNRTKELSKLIELLKDYDDFTELIDFIKNMISDSYLIKLKEVFVESPITSEILTNDNSNIYLDFRWKLELGRISSGVRNELATITKNYKNEPRKVLALFHVISEEKYYFLLDEELRKTIFYEKAFKDNIILACKYFVRNPGILNEHDLESIFVILNVFNPDTIIDNLYDIVTQKVLKKEYFFQYCTQLLLFPKAYEFPSRIINALNKLKESIKSYSNKSIIKKTLNTFIDYWKIHEEQLIRLKKDNFTIFKELGVARFHNIKHKCKDLLYSLNLREINCVFRSNLPPIPV